MLGKIAGRGRRGQERMRWFDGIIDSMDMSLSKLWELVKDRVNYTSIKDLAGKVLASSPIRPVGVTCSPLR